IKTAEARRRKVWRMSIPIMDEEKKFLIAVMVEPFNGALIHLLAADHQPHGMLIAGVNVKLISPGKPFLQIVKIIDRAGGISRLLQQFWKDRRLRRQL